VEVLAIALCSSKLLAWMRANVGDDLEPEAMPGQPMGLFLIGLCAAAKPTDAADRAFLLAAAEVLAQYATHVHAVIRIPTPKEAAAAAAAEIRKLAATVDPAPTAGAPVSVAIGLGAATPAALAVPPPKPAKS